jgi:hypothetical protein
MDPVTGCHGCAASPLAQSIDLAPAFFESRCSTETFARGHRGELAVRNALSDGKIEKLINGGACLVKALCGRLFGPERSQETILID